MTKGRRRQKGEGMRMEGGTEEGDKRVKGVNSNEKRD